MRTAPNPWGWITLILCGALVFGSVGYWAVGLTFGLISGLVVLMAPAYPILLQVMLTAIVVSACLWRGWWRLALGLGGLLIVVPQTVMVVVYAYQEWACTRAADPTACFAYLNGSVLLPIFVVIAVVAAAVELGVMVGVVLSVKRQSTSHPS
jgi:hypothetical protein